MATFLRLVRRLQGDTPAPTTAFPPKGGLWIRCNNKRLQANTRARTGWGFVAATSGNKQISVLFCVQIVQVRRKPCQSLNLLLLEEQTLSQAK